MKKIIVFIVILAICINCSLDHNSKMSINLDKEVKKIVIGYISDNQQYNSFIMMPVKGLENNDNLINDNGLLFGPAFQDILDELPSSLYFDISGKRIFYLSEINYFLMRQNLDFQIKNESNTIIQNGVELKEPRLLLIHKAIYFYYNNDGLIEINNRPDTIFVPKQLENTIQFENIK